MRLKFSIPFFLLIAVIAGRPAFAKTTEIGGFIGSRIESCIENRVKAQDIDILAEPFRHLTEGGCWQSEFMGKWMLGAIASYRYDNDPLLLEKITSAARMLMETQREDG